MRLGEERLPGISACQLAMNAPATDLDAGGNFEELEPDLAQARVGQGGTVEDFGPQDRQEQMGERAEP